MTVIIYVLISNCQWGVSHFIPKIIDINILLHQGILEYTLIVFPKSLQIHIGLGGGEA